jgi:hypothetical protein
MKPQCPKEKLTRYLWTASFWHLIMAQPKSELTPNEHSRYIRFYELTYLSTNFGLHPLNETQNTKKVILN